mmetsp:Transcript_4896/g.8359  ORF Transcript_4896/g.8359 Transcript_4896/m.8359 type:complete len:516 (-) Transcript_4896:32-1579(-)
MMVSSENNVMLNDIQAIACEEDPCEDEQIDSDAVKSTAALEIGQANDQAGAATFASLVVRRYLLASHLFGVFAEQVFQFVVVVFLTKAVLPEASLMLVSSYGFTSSLLVFSLGSHFGRYLDLESARSRRLRSIRAVLIGQYGCVLASTVACYALLSGEGKDSDTGILTSTGDPFDLTTTSLLIAIHLFGGFSLLFSEASTVAIEKDWAIVIAAGCDADYLGRLNIALRQIDLGSKMLSPTAAGFFLMAVGEQVQPAIIAAAIINFFAFFIEYCFLTKICALVPGLMMSWGDQNESSDKDNQEKRHCTSCSFFAGLVVYFQQKIAAGGLALAMLYLNVLSVGELMTAYLVSCGISLHFIGLWKGISSIVGIFGTRAFGFVSSRYSLATTSMLSITFFLGCLSLSFGSSFVANKSVALAVLVLGISISRIGLWSFDLAISQLIQETVPVHCRGIFGGTQHSLQAFFFALHFVSGLIWSKPDQFFILAAIGYSAVGFAFLLVLLGVYQSRIGSYSTIG